MGWRQIIDADMNTSYVGGLCLKFVQDSFHTDHPYPSAIDAWNANYGGGNHPNELPPSGKTVPVYFSLGNVEAGHAADALDDGLIASSTQLGYHSKPYFHPNLDDLIAVYAKYNGGCTYLGWSEYVGTIRVVEPDNEQTNQGEDMVTTQAQLDSMYNVILRRPRGVGEGEDVYLNKDSGWVYNNMVVSPERAQMLAMVDAQTKDLNDRITNLTSQLKVANDKSVSLVASVTDLTTRLDDSQGDNLVLTAKISELESKPIPECPKQPQTVGEWFNELINAIFKKKE